MGISFLIFISVPKLHQYSLRYHRFHNDSCKPFWRFGGKSDDLERERTCHWSTSREKDLGCSWCWRWRFEVGFASVSKSTNHMIQKHSDKWIWSKQMNRDIKSSLVTKPRKTKIYNYSDFIWSLEPYIFSKIISRAFLIYVKQSIHFVA